MLNTSDKTLAAIEEIIIRFTPKRQKNVTITRAVRLQEDLEIDSPRLIDIVLDVEDRFGIVLEDVEVQNTQTVGELIDLIEQGTAQISR